jgi:hypothetical protein
MPMEDRSFVPGLSGDLQGGGAPFRGVGDEPGPQGNGPTSRGVETDPGDRLGDQPGQTVGGEAKAAEPVAFGDGPEHQAFGDAGDGEPVTGWVTGQ